MPSTTPTNSSVITSTLPDPTSTTTPSTTTAEVTSQLNLATSSLANVTDATTTASLINATLIPPPVNHDAAIQAGHVVAIVLFTAAMLGVVICIYCYYKGKMNAKRFHLISRFRRGRSGSSSSSRHPLENEDDDDDDHDHDDLDPPPPRSRPRNDADLFTIGDVEDGEGDRARGKQGSGRNSQATLDEDYFYDEVFGESAFEDEATRTALKELTLSSGEEDLPDLEFKDNP